MSPAAREDQSEPNVFNCVVFSTSMLPGKMSQETIAKRPLARASPATQSDKRMEHEPTVIFDNPRKSVKEFLTTEFADFADRHTLTYPYYPRSENCEAERSTGLKTQEMAEIELLCVAQRCLTASLRELIGNGALGDGKSSQKNKIINVC